MKFRTELHVPKAAFQIGSSHKILCIGSCFAERMEAKLRERKFQTLLNPFGILFQPLALADCLQHIIAKKHFSVHDLVEHEGAFHSLSHHSDFSHPNPQAALAAINHAIDEAHEFVKSADVLLLTFGTAMAFEHNATGKPVGNCHRIPQQAFTKQLLKVEAIVAALSATLQKLSALNPSLNIVFSVSPVRYLSFGFHENQLAKATLLLAVHELQQQFPQTHYFPAYELMMDDLRDYRFMNEDLIHPNPQATDYVWEKFCAAFFDENTLKQLKETEEILAAFHHRPRLVNTDAHQKFLANFYSKTKALQAQMPHADWSEELKYFSVQAS